jgi:general secretion pathway protein K
VLIAAIGTYLLANARSEAALARNVRTAANAEALADAGVAEAVFNRTDTIAGNRWPLDGEPHMVLLNGGEIAIRLYDETAKINPNRASDALLSALFQALGVDRPRSRRIGAAIADWVGPEAEPRPQGAKLAQYRAAGKSYGPPNAAIESLDDLQLVLGMTPELFALALPYLTIYTDSDEPQQTNAGAIVKRALAIAAREEKISGDAATEASPDADVTAPTGPAPANANATKTDEQVLDLEVTAHAPDGGIFVRHAVVRIDPGNPRGYAVLDWRRGQLAE